MWDVLIIVGIVLMCLLSLVLTALRLPGIWLIVASGVGYGWWSGWESVDLTILLILGGIALLGELVEFGMSVITSRKAGASSRAAWGGLIGGLVGMIVFSIPVPIIGTVIGALLGCFAGAMIGELTVKSQIGHGVKVGFFAAVGFVLGTVAKLAFAMIMSVILVLSVINVGDKPVQSSEIEIPTSEIELPVSD